MKLSNETILASLKIISSGLASKELPVKVSYAIAKNMTKLASESKIYNQERDKLVEKYAIKDKDGKTVVTDNQIQIDPTKLDGWVKDNKELLAIESEVDIYTFKIETLDGINISPDELQAIIFMIEE